MAVTQDQVIEALRPVQDPELHRSIVDLEMVRDIRIDGGAITVLIALTVAGCPLRAEITSRVTGALRLLDDVASVNVEMTVMSPEQLEKVRRTLQSGPGGHAGHSHEGHGHDGHDHQTGGDTVRVAGTEDGHEGHNHGPAERIIPFTLPGSRTRVLGITSGKGGVGKSSVTVNLAVALAQLGHDVAVLDADVYGFSIPKMLGIQEDPTMRSEMIVPPEAFGVRCISMGFFIDEDKPVMWRGPMLHKALEQFLVDVAWDSPDFLIIDMPPGTGDVAMSLANYIPNSEIYVVTTPQPAAQRVAQRSGAMARHINLPLAGVIENMSWFTGDDGKRYEIFGAGGGEALAQSLNVSLLAQIPLVPEMREGGDIGVPVAAAGLTTEAGFVFEQLARMIEKAGPRRVYREELKIR